KTGTVFLSGLARPWVPFTPLADGQPVLKEKFITEAHCRGDILALCSFPHPGPRPPRFAGHLWLFRGPDGILLREYPQGKILGGLALSEDGRLLARQTDKARVQVSRVEQAGPPLLVTSKGGCHQDLKVDLGPAWLSARAGRWFHLVQWGAGTIEWKCTDGATH